MLDEMGGEPCTSGSDSTASTADGHNVRTRMWGDGAKRRKRRDIFESLD